MHSMPMQKVQCRANTGCKYYAIRTKYHSITCIQIASIKNCEIKRELI